MFKKRITPFLCTVICFAVASVTFVATLSYFSLKTKDEIRALRESASEQKTLTVSSFGEDSERYEKLYDIIGFIDSNYIREYDKDAAWAEVYKAYARSIGDKYSLYFTSDEYQALTAESAGNFVGIGIHAVYDDETHGVYIFRVMPDSPAEKAGIRDKDIIVAVGDTECTEDNYYDILDMIRGEKDTEVTLKLKRGEEFLTVTATRGSVASDNVIYEKIEDSIAYIRILTFSDMTLSNQFEAAIEKAQSEGCDRYIFDVRNNTGGYLTEICAVLDRLLPEGVIINIVDASGNTRTENSDADCLKAPFTVLCNSSTASAAELFVAALRDYGLAESVGETTFGKGTVQNTKLLPDGSAIKASTGYYNPPCNISYDGIGIKPDREVGLPEKWENNFYRMPREEDSQLQKAIEIIKNK